MEDTDNQRLTARSDVTTRLHRVPGTPRTSRVTRPYRTSRAAGRAANKTKYSFKEKLLLQCIVCGVILATLMFANLINSSFTNRITSWIGTRITENIDFKGDNITGFFNAVKTIFGYENIPASTTENPEKTPDAMINDESNSEKIGNATHSDEINPQDGIEIGVSTESDMEAVDVIRVDEDMLYELNSAEDIYNQNQN